MSIRLRLTLLYSAILALTLILFATLLNVTVQKVTMATIAESLKTESKRVTDNPIQVGLREFKLPAEVFATEKTYFQVVDGAGSITDTTDNLDKHTLPLGKDAWQTLKTGKSTVGYESPPGFAGARLMIYNAPIYLGGQRAGILQTARPIGDQDRALGLLRRLLAAGTTLSTLIAFGIGWLLAGAALRPINRITQTAQAIGAERDFGRRVRYSGPMDEVGRLATTFNTMLEALQTAYQAQRRFVADASHELRTPLTTIRGNIGLLQREPPINPEDRAAVLSDMADESERMSRLVNDLLMLARADAGRPLARTPVPVKNLVEEVCREGRVLAPDKTILCHAVADLTATGDRDAIKQVLLILLDNALKFTPPGGTISITAEAAGASISMSVRDTGPGIEPEAMPHIFERFYLADPSRTGAGAGLGLSIAKALVEAQSGSITARSEPGEGSVFTLTLPQAATSPQAQEQAVPSGGGR